MSNNNTYDQITHIHLLNDAISRMGNNHFKFMISFFSVIAFAITMDKFIWEMSSEAFIGFYIANFMLSTLALVGCFVMSIKYLKIERKFRQIQANAFNNKYSTYVMNPTEILDSEPNIKKKGFTFWFQLSLLVIAILAGITFVILKELL